DEHVLRGLQQLHPPRTAGEARRAADRGGGLARVLHGGADVTGGSPRARGAELPSSTCLSPSSPRRRRRRRCPLRTPCPRPGRARRSPSATARCSSGAPRGAVRSTVRTTPHPASAPSTCTASAAPPPTGPTS